MIDKLLNEGVQKFIHEHENVDPFELSLKYKEIGGVPIKEIVQQIVARKKAKQKLPSWYACNDIIYPVKVSVEQSSSEISANYKASLVNGMQFADLTGGMGVDSWTFAQEFKNGTYVEQNEELVSLCQHNLTKLGVTNIDFKHSTAKHFLNNNSQKLDLIYLDPARRDQNKKKVFKLHDCTPNVIQLIPQLLKCSSNVLIKTAPLLDITQTLKDLKYVAEAHVVAVQNDCKEVLYLLNDQGQSNPEIITVNFPSTGGPQNFSFTLDNEINAITQIGPIKNYLYEPNSAIMKAGAFKTIAQKFSLTKLHQNTHLYSSDSLHEDFPGRIFEIIGTCSYSKKEAKKLLTKKKSNVAVRNFPDDPEKVKKKLGLQDGGEVYVFACRQFDESLVVIKCSKVLTQ